MLSKTPVCYLQILYRLILAKERSKNNDYTSIFQQNPGNVKKLGMALINGRKRAPPIKVIYNNEIKSSNIDMANSLHDFVLRKLCVL